MNDYFLLRVPNWLKEYGNTGNPDQRNVVDFMICESPEAVRALQSELILIKSGKIEDEKLDKIIGPKRKNLYNDYQNWAKMMLMWISEYKG